MELEVYLCTVYIIFEIRRYIGSKFAIYMKSNLLSINLKLLLLLVIEKYENIKKENLLVLL